MESPNTQRLSACFLMTVLIHASVVALLYFFPPVQAVESQKEPEVTWISLGTLDGNIDNKGLAAHSQNPSQNPIANAGALSVTKTEPKKTEPKDLIPSKPTEPLPSKKDPDPKTNQTHKTEKKEVKLPEKKNSREAKNIPDKNQTPKTPQNSNNPNHHSQKPNSNQSDQDKRINNALNKLKKEASSEGNANGSRTGSGSQNGFGGRDGKPGGSNAGCGSYSSRVRSIIMGRWRRPAGSPVLAKKPTIHVSVSASGKVSWSWVQRSGDIGADNAAMLAVQGAVPAPPDNCDEAAKNGVTIGFNR